MNARENAAILLLSGVLLSVPLEAGPDDEVWLSLFNGENLEGWTAKISGYELGQNYRQTFRVEDGLLKASYDRYQNFGNRFGHLFYEEEFSHYRLRLEYRFVGDQASGAPEWAFRNSGIMVHCQHPETVRKEQDFPISIEVQLLGGAETGERPTGNLCTPGTHVEMDGELITDHCVSSSSPTYRGDQWVQAEVLVLGSEKIEHRINGDTVLVYSRPQIGGGAVAEHDSAVKKDGELLESGYISLQGESHPVHFRKIELLPLVGCMDPEASNYKSYFVASDSSQCRY